MNNTRRPVKRLTRKAVLKVVETAENTTIADALRQMEIHATRRDIKAGEKLFGVLKEALGAQCTKNGSDDVILQKAIASLLLARVSFSLHKTQEFKAGIGPNEALELYGQRTATK